MNARSPLALAAATLVALTACGKSPAPAATPAPDAAASTSSHCLQYAPGMVTLSGMATTRMMSAPGKASRNAMLLTLDAPICIATPAARAAEYPAVDSIKVIELVPQSDFADAFSLAGQRVTAHGGLVPMSGDGVAAPVGMVLRTLKPAQ